MSRPPPVTDTDGDGLSLSVHSLPNEILGNIFLEYLPYGGSQVLVGSLSGTTITLSHVCSRWREIVLDTPRLWSQLSLRLNEESWQKKHSWDQVIQFVSDWFSKAKDRPLKLRFGYEPEFLAVCGGRIIAEGDFNYLLAPLMERIQDLELDIYRSPQHFSALPPNKFLQLESIVLHRTPFEQTIVEMVWDPTSNGPLTIFRDAPRLRRLSMFFPLFGYRLSSVLIPWFQLTHLIISHYIYPAIWEELFLQCVNLTHGVFYIHSDSDRARLISHPKTTLPRVVELTLLCGGSIHPSFLTPSLLRNFRLPKLQTLRLGPLHLEEIFMEDKIYLIPHLSLVRRLSFQSYFYWKVVKSNHLLATELLKFAENVEEFDISSTKDYSSIIKALTISEGNDIILPKLKSISIHFENARNLLQLQDFSMAILGEMVDSRWHPQRIPTRLQKIRVLLTWAIEPHLTKALARNMKKSLENELAGYVAEGLILDVSISRAQEVHWRDRLQPDENYWKEGMECIRSS